MEGLHKSVADMVVERLKKKPEKTMFYMESEQFVKFKLVLIAILVLFVHFF